MHHCVYAHAAGPGVWSRYVLCQWAGCVEQVRTVSVGHAGVWSRYVLCQKLCAAGLVKAQRTVQNYGRISQAMTYIQCRCALIRITALE